MKNISSNRKERLHLRRNEVTGDIEMKCIFQRMDEFFEVNEIYYMWYCMQRSKNQMVILIIIEKPKKSHTMAE